MTDHIVKAATWMGRHPLTTAYIAVVVTVLLAIELLARL